MSQLTLPYISPYHIQSWEQEIQTGTREQLEEMKRLCDYQRRSWMNSAHRMRTKGLIPDLEISMAWKYHRRLLMLRRATRKTQVPVQAALF